MAYYKDKEGCFPRPHHRAKKKKTHSCKIGKKVTPTPIFYLFPSGWVITMSMSPQDDFPRLYDPPHTIITCGIVFIVMSDQHNKDWNFYQKSRTLLQYAPSSMLTRCYTCLTFCSELHQQYYDTYLIKLLTLLLNKL